jgi:hypothetical protein
VFDIYREKNDQTNEVLHRLKQKNSIRRTHKTENNNEVKPQKIIIMKAANYI